MKTVLKSSLKHNGLYPKKIFKTFDSSIVKILKIEESNKSWVEERRKKKVMN